jgi:hypothetical protein
MGEPANLKASSSFGPLPEGSAFGTSSWGALTMGSSTLGWGGLAKSSESSSRDGQAESLFDILAKGSPA